MTHLNLILQRLKNPSVLLSIASQIVTLLLLFHIKVDINLVTGAIAAISSILVLLGIMSDPTTQNKGYTDDLFPCESCGSDTPHVLVNGKLVCRTCGTEQPQR